MTCVLSTTHWINDWRVSQLPPDYRWIKLPTVTTFNFYPKQLLRNTFEASTSRHTHCEHLSITSGAHWTVFFVWVLPVTRKVHFISFFISLCPSNATTKFLLLLLLLLVWSLVLVNVHQSKMWYSSVHWFVCLSLPAHQAHHLIRWVVLKDTALDPHFTSEHCD